MYKFCLLKFYCDKYLSSSVARSYDHLNKYVSVIFQIPCAMVLVKFLFSIKNYKKVGKRENLKSESVASVIHSRDIGKVTNNVAASFTSSGLAIDLQHALYHRLEWSLKCILLHS